MKLISAMAAIVLATSTLANAAPRHTKGKTGKATVSKSAKHAKPAKRPVAKTTTVQRTSAPPVQRASAVTVQRTSPVREPLPVRITMPYAAAPAAKAAVVKEHDVKAEELEIKRLKTTIKTAEKAGDWRQAARDRRVMYQLEADVRADKKDSQDRLRASRNSTKKSRIPFWGWWR